jgi:acetoin utilization protein AcuB
MATYASRPSRRTSRPAHDVREGALFSVTVEELMTTRLLMIAADAEVQDAREMLERHGVHHLLVEDRGRVVAIVSDRDILRAVSPYAGGISAQRRDEATLRRRVFQIASYRLITVPPDAAALEAAALMLEHRISSLPVVGEDGRIKGLVTRSDLLRGMLACLLPEG